MIGIAELKVKYQKIVADCREAEKTADTTLARIEAKKKLEAENKSYISAALPIDERNVARRLYHSAWNAVSFPNGEEGTAFMADYSGKE